MFALQLPIKMPICSGAYSGWHPGGEEARRASGTTGGPEAGQVNHARVLIEKGESPRDVARSMRVGKSTLYRALKEGAV